MRRAAAIVIGICAAFHTAPAKAGVWAWGCQGQLGGQQVIFNRYSLFVADSKEKMGDVRKLIDEKIDGLVKADKTQYERVDSNAGLESPLVFTLAGNDSRKLVLTEKSSKKTSGKSRLICGRDETTDIFRKVYRYERENEAARDITMQCVEYQLSTTGGRRGC